MSTTYTFTLNLTRGSLGFFGGTTVDVDAEAVIDDAAVAGSASNKVYNVPVDVSAVQAVGILSSTDMTLKTNSNTTPDDTFDLKAGVPVLWHPDCGLANPLTVDVVTWHATNLSTDVARLQVFVGYEPTP